MESSADKVSRLVGALETLSDQEYSLLYSGDHAGVIVIQNQCQPVIDEICRLMQEPSLLRLLDPTTRTRVDGWLEKQTAQLERIAADKSSLREGLQLLRNAQSRTQLFRTAYGHKDVAESLRTSYTEIG